MPEWLVRLIGHEFELEELVDHFTSADRNVKKDEDGYYLRSSDFNTMTDPSAVRARALEILGYMNGAMKLHSGDSYRPVETDMVTRVDEKGARHHHIVVSDTIGVRDRVTVELNGGNQDSTGDVPQSPSEAEVLVTLADQNEKGSGRSAFQREGRLDQPLQGVGGVL